MNLVAKNNEAVRDPVCGMEVLPNATAITAEIDGETYHFCAESCRKSFVKNPQKFLCPEASKRKGIWGRYLERLERATGGQAVKCH